MPALPMTTDLLKGILSQENNGGQDLCVCTLSIFLAAKSVIVRRVRRADQTTSVPSLGCARDPESVMGVCPSVVQSCRQKGCSCNKAAGSEPSQQGMNKRELITFPHKAALFLSPHFPSLE